MESNQHGVFFLRRNFCFCFFSQQCWSAHVWKCSLLQCYSGSDEKFPQ